MRLEGVKLDRELPLTYTGRIREGQSVAQSHGENQGQGVVARLY